MPLRRWVFDFRGVYGYAYRAPLGVPLRGLSFGFGVSGFWVSGFRVPSKDLF